MLAARMDPQRRKPVTKPCIVLIVIYVGKGSPWSLLLLFSQKSYGSFRGSVHKILTIKKKDFFYQPLGRLQQTPGYKVLLVWDFALPAWISAVIITWSRLLCLGLFFLPHSHILVAIKVLASTIPFHSTTSQATSGTEEAAVIILPLISSHFCSNVTRCNSISLHCILHTKGRTPCQASLQGRLLRLRSTWCLCPLQVWDSD